MQLEGKIKKIGENKVNNNFVKRELILTTYGEYAQTILIEFSGKTISELENYREGDPVAIDINIRGREYKDQQGLTKYFNSIQGWKITKQESLDLLG